MVFHAKIEPDGKLVCIALPFDAKKEFGVPKGTIRVAGRVNSVPYRANLLSRGGGVHVLRLAGPMQKKLGYTGQPLAVTVEMEAENMAGGTTPEATTGIKPTCGVDVLEAINQRRSVRHFAARTVEEDLLTTVLNAGMCAPTAKNKRPYHFVVVEDAALRGKISDGNQHAWMLKDAPCCIVVCADSVAEATWDFLQQDCAAAVQNMLLAAHGLGLGAVWCGVAKGRDWAGLLAEELNLPEKVVPAAVVVLGHPAADVETGARKSRFEAGKVHHNGW